MSLLTRVYGHDGLIGVAMKLESPKQRVLVRGNLELQGQSLPVEFSPDGFAGDAPGRPRPSVEGPIEVDAGVEMTAVGGAVANCAEPAGVPVLTVTSQVGGGARMRTRYAISDLAAYRAAFDRVCRAGLQVMAAGTTPGKDGRFTTDLRVANPGPEAVTVTSKAYQQGGVEWTLASVTVGAGQVTTLTITARGDECAPQTPWATGRLTADGKPLRVKGRRPGC